MCVMPKQVKNEKGFTLLFAVLVSVLVLAVGASIISIALKQVILSGAGRESQYAFYAANTGVECALYWDLNGSQIVGGTLRYVFQPPGEDQLEDLAEVRCAGWGLQSGNWIGGGTEPDVSGYMDNEWSTTSGANSTATTFRIAVQNDVDGAESVLYCAEVTVEKEETDVDGDGSEEILTTITSQGLNTCDPNNNARAVERGLVLQYTS